MNDVSILETNNRDLRDLCDIGVPRDPRKGRSNVTQSAPNRKIVPLKEENKSPSEKVLIKSLLDMNIAIPKCLADEYPELAYIDNLPMHLRPNPEEIEKLKLKYRAIKEKGKPEKSEVSRKSPPSTPIMEMLSQEVNQKEQIKHVTEKSAKTLIDDSIEKFQEVEKTHVKSPLLPTPSCTEPSTDNNNMPYKLPYDTNKWYIPQHDPRWLTHCEKHNTMISDRDATYIVVNDNQFLVSDGLTKITVNYMVWFVKLNLSKRKMEIRLSKEGNIEGSYTFGEPIIHLHISGIKYSVYYRGGLRRVYIDGFLFNLYADAPPLTIYIAGSGHDIKIKSSTNKIYLDGLAVCHYGKNNMRVGIDSLKHAMCFEPNPKPILFDGQPSEIRFIGQYSYLSNMKGRFGIRFDGGPTSVLINGVKYTIEMDRPKVITLPDDNSRHLISIGGPSHEVIIGGVPHELKFNGPPIEVQIGTRILPIQLKGEVKAVKLLGELVMSESRIQELCGGIDIDVTEAVELDAESHQIPGK